MKVLYLINFAGKAGTEKYVENLMRALHPHQCQCGLCYNIAGPLVERAQELKVPVFQLPMRHCFDLVAAKALAKLCQAEGFDVIHAQYPRENYIAVLSKRFGNPARIVFTVHLTLRQSLRWRIFNPIFTRKDHRVITVCSEGEEILIQNGIPKNRIVVIFNGIDAKAMPHRNKSILREFGISNEEVVLTILARFSPEKGLPFLCQAIARLKTKTQVPFRVLIAGDGDQMNEIRQLLVAEGLTDTILLLGFRSDTSKLLAASDIYINSSSCNEAMSFAILEAMACHLPVVATDVGGNRTLVELEETSGYIVPYGDIDSFSTSLQKLIENKTLRMKYGEAAFQKSQGTFSLEQSIKQTFNTYQ